MRGPHSPYMAGPHSPNIAGEEFQDKWLPPFESEKARSTRRKMRQAPQLVEQVQRLWEVAYSKRRSNIASLFRMSFAEYANYHPNHNPNPDPDPNPNPNQVR